MLDRADECRRFCPSVDPYVDYPRRASGGWPAAVPVVEYADHVWRLRQGVVLAVELNSRPQRERRFLAAEAPDDVARVAVDLVDGRYRSAGDEQVAVGVEVDSVDVEVVVWDRRTGRWRMRLSVIGT